ncbi:hypothetical protein GCM10027521_36490 [Amycolatopsis cihanbeyliensis]
MKKIISTALVGGTLIAGGIMLASPAWSAEEKAPCYLTAYNPWRSGAEVVGMGGRNCGGSAQVTVRLAKDVFGPDPILAQQTKTISVDRFSVSGGCVGHGEYYSWTISSSGNEKESARVVHC